MLPVLESGEETLVGGQAVMEGVMMRAPHSYCVAVRKPNGEIVTEELPVKRPSETRPYLKWPVLRGIGVLGQAMSLGMKALQFSANQALAEEMGTKEGEKPISNWMMGLQLLFSLAFFLFAYKLVPLKLTELISKGFPAMTTPGFEGRVLFNLVDGVIRLTIFITFMWLMSLTKDMRRMFEYHGAEHKVVFNFESGQPVSVENAQKFVTWHPRCGTSFMFVIMLISMILYMFIPVEGFAAKFAIRIALLPVVVGFSYELIRFAARKRGSFLALLTAPGLWTQRITTKQPADDQAEIAVRALEGAMALEAQQGGELVIA
jgi:uncharacterized protein YqhQ